MRDGSNERTLGHMTVHATADRLVLEEFRLSDGASHADADRALAAADPSGVPLLTSIADERDVASVRRVGPRSSPDGDTIDHASFGDLVSRWGAVHTYRPRIAEDSLARPTSYRLAVTESGINDTDPTFVVRGPSGQAPPSADAAPAGLLWIGAPRDSHAGLLVVIGDGETAADTSWPLSLGQALGVRIYRGLART
jgi:hypothetical protein